MNLGRIIGKKKDQVPDKSKRIITADYVFKKALAAQGDLSSESDELEHIDYASTLVVVYYDTIYNFFFSHGKV